MKPDAYYASDWVLVPRNLPSESLRYLAGFDMESIGNNRYDAADECWAGVLEQVAKLPPLLDFSNPVFHKGTNLTVRRGTKWYGKEFGIVRVGGYDLVVALTTTTYKFYQLTDHILRDEHDPSCRTVDGLREEMKRVYEGFEDTEEVTLVYFQVPGVNLPEAPDAEG